MNFLSFNLFIYFIKFHLIWIFLLICRQIVGEYIYFIESKYWAIKEIFVTFVFRFGTLRLSDFLTYKKSSLWYFVDLPCIQVTNGFSSGLSSEVYPNPLWDRWGYIVYRYWHGPSVCSDISISICRTWRVYGSHLFTPGHSSSFPPFLPPSTFRHPYDSRRPNKNGHARCLPLMLKNHSRPFSSALIVFIVSTVPKYQYIYSQTIILNVKKFLPNAFVKMFPSLCKNSSFYLVHWD